MYSQWRREGNRGNVPPPRNRKNCRRKMSNLPEVYTSEKRQKSSKKRVKIYEKSQFSIDILIKKIKIFLKFFKVLVFSGHNAQNFDVDLLIFPCPMEIIHQILMILNFSTNYSQFSPKNSRIFIPLPIFLLELSQFFFVFLIYFLT